MTLTRDTYDNLSRAPRKPKDADLDFGDPIDPSTVHYATDPEDAIRVALSSIVSDGVQAITVQKQDSGDYLLAADDGRKIKGPGERCTLHIDDGDVTIPDNKPIRMFLTGESGDMKITLIQGLEIKVVASDPKLEEDRRFRNLEMRADELIDRRKVITKADVSMWSPQAALILRLTRRRLRAPKPIPDEVHQLEDAAKAPVIDDISFAALARVPEVQPLLAVRKDLTPARTERLVNFARGGGSWKETSLRLSANQNLDERTWKKIQPFADKAALLQMAANPTCPVIGKIIDDWTHAVAERNFGWYQGSQSNPYMPELGEALIKRHDLTAEQRIKVEDANKVWTRYVDYINDFTKKHSMPLVNRKPVLLA